MKKNYLLAASIIFASGFYLTELILNSSSMSVWQYLFIYLYFISILSSIFAWIRRKVGGFEGRKVFAYLIYASALGAITMLSWSYDLIYYPQVATVSITNQGRSDASRGEEIWLTSISVDSKSLDMAEIELPPGWEHTDTGLLSASIDSKPLVLRLPRARTVQLFFASHAWSGIVGINEGDESSERDLYQENADSGYIYSVETIHDFKITLYSIVRTASGYILLSSLFYASFLLLRGKLRMIGGGRASNPIGGGMGKSGTILAGISVVTFIAISFPMFVLSLYNTPSADDFYNAMHIRDLWGNTGSFMTVIGGAVKAAITIYHTWQGTYAGIFFGALQPFVFHSEGYKAVGIIFLSGFILSNLIFSFCLFKKVLNWRNAHILFCCLIYCFVSIQFMPSPIEGLYWYSGAVLYTLFHCLFLLYMGCICLSLKANSTVGKTLLLLVSQCLGFILGGGNYITVLFAVILMGILSIVGIWKQFERWYVLSLSLPGLFAGFLLNILAPGNAIRQENLTGISPIKAVLDSFFFAKWFAADHLNVITILLLASTIPFIGDMTRHETFRFQFPGLVSFFSYSLYASTFTPTLYTMNSFGPGRVLNISYFLLILLFYVNLVYWVGWLSQRLNISHSAENSKKLKVISVRMIYITCSLAILLLAYKSYRNVGVIPSVSAIHSLVTGQAHRYEVEYKKRYEILTDPAITQVNFPPYRDKPAMLFFDDIREDPEDWRNIGIAQYFNKQTVRLEQ